VAKVVSLSILYLQRKRKKCLVDQKNWMYFTLRQCFLFTIFTTYLIGTKIITQTKNCRKIFYRKSAGTKTLINVPPILKRMTSEGLFLLFCFTNIAAVSWSTYACIDQLINFWVYSEPNWLSYLALMREWFLCLSSTPPNPCMTKAARASERPTRTYPFEKILMRPARVHALKQL
jgi:hypothetical protein